MALALLKYQFFLKNQYWVASGILFGIAAAVWTGPETKAGFLVIIVIFILASVVVRGIVQGIISILQMKDERAEKEGDEKSPSEGDTPASVGDTTNERSAGPQANDENAEKKSG